MPNGQSRNSIALTFERLQASKRRAFIPYITAGHPDPQVALDVLTMLADEGADVLELGVPFSDPIADGPTIQRATWQAIEKGVDIGRVIAWTAEFSAQRDTPIVLFSYLNPVWRYGPERFLPVARDAGAAGILITDLPVDADPELERRLSAGGLDLIRLVAPTTPRVRAVRIAEAAQGFIYYISRTGVTGERERLRQGLREDVETLRSVTDLPIAVGFGISNADQARAVAEIADGVVVGSALVRKLEEDGLSSARALAREIRTAIDAAL